MVIVPERVYLVCSIFCFMERTSFFISSVSPKATFSLENSYSCGLCGVPGRFDRDLVTQSFQSPDEIAFEAICFEPIEVDTSHIA
jgi:hypothetical protein